MVDKSSECNLGSLLPTSLMEKTYGRIRPGLESVLPSVYRSENRRNMVKHS